ncbi:MAG: peptidoglycan DD-metalloendopeptidase family protein [Chloroflexi bacterium]|nr:peptidoglycan DD-metalloendopeptidase family protein [Chloroflexota bacterium]
MRYLIVAACVLLLTACGGGSASGPEESPQLIVLPFQTTSPAASRTATPSATPSSTPSPTATAAPTLDVSGSFPQQGGFLLVRLLNPPAGLNEATLYFAGASYSMLPEGEHWYAVVGLATDFAPGDYTVDIAAPLADLASASVTIAPGGFQYESLELPPSSIDLLADTVAVEAERQTLAQVYAGFTPQRLWSGAWLIPAAGAITDPFGLQRSINGGPYYPHSGTDIAAEKGTPVVAAAAGTVALARALYLYGNAVVIDHGAGVFTAYNHMDSIAVSEGQTVAAGDVLGYMGETGFVNGPHLHWEAIVRGVRIDPTLWTYGPVEP